MVESTNLTCPPSCKEPAEFRPPPSPTMLRCSVEVESVRVWGRGLREAAVAVDPVDMGGGAWKRTSF